MIINKRPKKPKELPAKTVAIIGLAWQGYTDPKMMALIVGAAAEEVEGVLESRDFRIRSALRSGLRGDTAIIEVPIRCSGCNAMISRVPCVMCCVGGER